jgi:hypothetical protein
MRLLLYLLYHLEARTCVGIYACEDLSQSSKDENQSHPQNILQFWASMKVYDCETMYSLVGAGLVKRIVQATMIYWFNRYFFLL